MRWRRRSAGCPRTAGPPGMFGRRDRCLLVLSQLAGVPYRHLATLTAGDIHIEEGVATIRSAAGEWTLGAADDVDLVRAVRGRPVAEDPGPGRHETEHQDHRPGPEEGAGGGPPVAARLPHRAGPRRQRRRVVPLLPPIDQWGALPLPLQRLSPHSLSRRARDLLAGDLGAHRDLPVDPDPEPEVHRTGEAAGHQPAASSAYDAADAAAAWDRRRRDLQDLAGIIDVLTDVERRADELNRRAAELVEGWL